MLTNFIVENILQYVLDHYIYMYYVYYVYLKYVKDFNF